MKSVYISGPLRADSLYKMHLNVRLARDEAELLWKLGFAVLCPHLNTDGMVGMLEDERRFREGDLILMNSIDMIDMLPGWEESEGSVIEHARAFELKMDCVYKTLLHRPTWSLAKREKESYKRLHTNWYKEDMINYSRLT